MPSQQKKTRKGMSLKNSPSKRFLVKQPPQEIDIEAYVFEKDITQSYPLENVIVEQDEDMNDTFYYKDGDDKIKLKKKKIGDGATANVFEIAPPQPLSFIYKEFKRPTDQTIELNILESLKTQPILCNVVNSHIITKPDTKKIIVMDKYDGALRDLLKEPIISYNLLKETKLNIFKQILHDVYCLYTRELYYTDLKLDNILYKITGTSTFKIALGDIGSICSKKINPSTPCASTYYPPETIDSQYKYNTDKIIVWNLGIMLLELLFISKYEDGITNLGLLYDGRDGNTKVGRWPVYRFQDSKTNKNKRAKKKDIKEDYDNFMKKLEEDKNNILVEQYFDYKYNGKDTIYDLIKQLLEFDSTKRITLKQVCVKLGLLEKSPAPAGESRVKIVKPVSPPLGKTGRFSVSLIDEAHLPPKPKTPSPPKTRKNTVRGEYIKGPDGNQLYSKGKPLTKKKYITPSGKSFAVTSL